jgi:cell division protein FtsZ
MSVVAAVGGLALLAQAISTPKPGAPKVAVCGLGGVGGHLLHRYVETAGSSEARTICIDNDAIALNRRNVDRSLLLAPPGATGQDGWPPVEVLFARYRREIGTEIEDCDLLIVLVGLGGHCGTRLAPEVARLGRESGAVVIAITVMPFSFESRRAVHAEAGRFMLSRSAQWIVSVPMDAIAASYDPTTPFLDVVEMGDRIAITALQESIRNAAAIFGALQNTESAASKQAARIMRAQLADLR